MIVVHRLTHPEQPLYLNAELIVTVESTPDTVVSLTSAAKFVVLESADEVAARILDWNASVLARALAESGDAPAATDPAAAAGA